MVAITVAREPEVGEGQKLLKEVAGRKVLITRHRGVLYAFDSHCYHMGHSLLEGDLEDVASLHPCIVCPAHRHRIDLRTGCRVETDLCGSACMSADQKQRIYQVFTDGDKIQLYIPDAPQQEAPLPSDKYNFWTVQKQAMNTPPRQSFGLFGTVTASEPPTPPHPEPYAEISLSQSPPASVVQQPPSQQPQHVRGQSQMQGQIQFRSARARAAILNNYKPPPLAEPSQPRGLQGVPRAASSGGLSTQQVAGSGQRTLQDMWARPQQQLAVKAAGPEAMEMD